MLQVAPKNAKKNASNQQPPPEILGCFLPCSVLPPQLCLRFETCKFNLLSPAHTKFQSNES